MVYMVMSVAPSEDCSTLIRDNYIQKTLQSFEDEEEEVDDKTCTENIIKYIDDMCGWVPDRNVQYRRRVPQTDKTSKGSGRGCRAGKPDWDSLSRRTGRNRGAGDNGQQPAIEYEFQHYSNLRKYIEQYRRFHTCGGPLEKLSQSAYGRTKTIYYANDSAAGASEAPPTGDGASEVRPSSQHIQEAPRGSTVRSYEENPPPATAPKYQSMTDAALRKRSVSLGNYTNHGWSNIPPGVVCGEPPPQKPTTSNKDSPMQWTINEHGLTIYQDKSSPTVFQQRDSARPVPGKSSPLPIAGFGSHGSYSHLPFFTPSQHAAGLQQPGKQLTTPPNIPTNLPVTSGFSIDRTIGISRSSSTGVIHDQGTLFKDFYSQLVNAAVHLQITREQKSGYKNQENYKKLQNNLNLTPFRQNKTYESKTCENRTCKTETCENRTCERSGTRESRTRESRTRESRTRESRTRESRTRDSSRTYEGSTPVSRATKNRPSESKYSPIQIQCPSHHSFDSASTCSSNGSSAKNSAAHRSPISTPKTCYVETYQAPHTALSSTDKRNTRFPPSESTLRREVLCRVSMNEHKTDLDVDHRVAVCEATWF